MGQLDTSTDTCVVISMPVDVARHLYVTLCGQQSHVQLALNFNTMPDETEMLVQELANYTMVSDALGHAIEELDGPLR